MCSFNEIALLKGEYSSVSNCVKASLVHRLFNEDFYPCLKNFKWNCVLLSEKDLFDYYSYLKHEKEKHYTPLSFWFWKYTSKKPGEGLVRFSIIMVLIMLVGNLL